MSENKYPLSTEEAKKSNILVTGTNQQGKSRLAMAIADKLMSESWQVIVFDNVGIWKNKSSIPLYFEVSENSMRYVIPKNSSIIYDISYLLPSYQKEFVENVLADLWRNRLRGETDKQTLIVFEESHLYMRNIRSLLGQNLMRICSVGANHKIRTLAISPSLTGLDTEFIRLCQQRYHFKLGCELNAKRRFRGYYSKDWQVVAENLDVGYCIYYINGKLKVHGIPLFESNTTPKPYRIPKTTQKKRSLWRVIKDQFNSGKLTKGFTSEDESENYYGVYGNTVEDEDDAFTEEENEDVWGF